MRSRGPMFVLSLLLLTLFVLTASSFAIPAFSRQYGTSCTTCHVDFPKLNDFGKAFKDAGFKFPKDDESFMKVPPVMLGAPAQKELWPILIRAPGTIPGLPPAIAGSIRSIQSMARHREYFKSRRADLTARPECIPPHRFSSRGLFSIFMAGGNFGSDIAF